MMARVKAAPITLKQSWNTRNAIALGEADYIPSRLGQIEELSLHGLPVDLRKITDALQDKAASRLKALCLHSVHRRDIPMHLMLPVEDSLFFGGEAPHLRTLLLGNCRLSWTSPLLHNLTYMEIYQEKSVPFFCSFMCFLTSLITQGIACTSSHCR